MHRAHTRTRRRLPSASTIFTVCKFGSHRLRVRLLAWLTLLPKLGVLPQV
jgi:hypothetical protein